MELSDILEQLKQSQDPRAIEAWEKLGNSLSNYWGVSFAKLKSLSLELKRNHSLASQLWDTGIHDARVLATMIENPREVDIEQINTQIKSIDYWDLADKYCTNIVAKTKLADELIDKWRHSKQEILKRSAFTLIVCKTKIAKVVDNAEFKDYLAQIQEEIHNAPNWVREAMNYALISIGGMNRDLHGAALDAAHQIGLVHVDYADKNYETPDARVKLNDPRILSRLSN